MIAASVPSETLLNFDHLQASRLLVPFENSTLQIALVGCGGTGSWLAPHLARLAKLITETTSAAVDLRFIDPDSVEEVNCYRQNFCQAEIGWNKAQALAARYGLAWGVDIRASAAPFELASLNSPGAAPRSIIVGCVDNAAARREIANVAEKTRSWWLDCGNHHSAGQVLLGSGAPHPPNPFKLPGFCSWLPLPTVQHPELLEDAPAPLEGRAASCARAALAGAQGLTINATVAALAADMLHRLLITKDLTHYAVYLDLAAGSMRAKYITPKELEAK